jgi:hypothetical protein
MWLACTGALLVMAIMMYLAMGRERPAESGQDLGGAVHSAPALPGARAAV